MVWLDFYRLWNKQIKNWIDKIGFQNFQTESTFFIFENQTNMIDFDWFASVCRVFQFCSHP